MHLIKEQFMFSQLQDKALITVNPNVLLDMKLGGNIRRKRRNFDEFKAKIKAQGIIQPVVARPIEGNENCLELLGGYGRRDAALAIDLAEVPVLIRLVDDKTALEIHLSENVDRVDVTIVDEVEFARRYISLHHGDRQSAATALGWDLSKMSSRLELLTCTADVLDALDDGKIKAGHALILSVFNPTIQNNTLAKILKENWSVKDTKAKANQVQIPLSVAKFDLTECNTCQFNSQRQSGLFDMGDVEAKCSNNGCFKQKNTVYMEIKRQEAEERFGKVLFLSQTHKADRKTVSAVVVGDSQYNEGCEGCSNRVAIIDDTITGSAGRISESQCIDLKCFAKCVKANAPQPVENVALPATSTNEKTGQASQEAGQSEKAITKKTVVAGNISNPAVDAHIAELRDIAGEQVKNSQAFSLALQVVSLIKFTGYKTISNVDTSVSKLMTKSEDELRNMINGMVLHAAKKSTSFGGGDIKGASKLLAYCASVDGDGLGQLSAKWVPTEKVLKLYTTAQLIQLCKLSGFAEAMEKKAAKSFDKISKGKKDVLLKALLATPFDWTHFAPAGYQKLLPKFE